MGVAALDEIGKGSHPAQSPPPLQGGDLFAWNWYQENCSGFVRDFGLMPHLLEKLDLSEAGMRLMVMRLGRVHKTMVNLALKEIQKERDKAS